MGAATALLHGDRDPSIAALVLDSAFADLTQLAEEMVERGREAVSLGLCFEREGGEGREEGLLAYRRNLFYTAWHAGDSGEVGGKRKSEVDPVVIFITPILSERRGTKEGAQSEAE